MIRWLSQIQTKNGEAHLSNGPNHWHSRRAWPPTVASFGSGVEVIYSKLLGREGDGIYQLIVGAVVSFPFFASRRFGASNRCFFFPMTLRLTTKIASEYRHTRMSPLMIFLQKRGGSMVKSVKSRYDRLNDQGSNKLNKRITPCEMKRLDNLKNHMSFRLDFEAGRSLHEFFPTFAHPFFQKGIHFHQITRGVKRWWYAFYTASSTSHSLGGEADTVEVSVSRDEVSGFLRLTLSNCKQVVVPGGSRWEGIFCWEHGDDFWGCWCFFLNRRIIKGGCLCHVFFVGGGGGFDIM